MTPMELAAFVALTHVVVFVAGLYACRVGR